MPKKIRELKQMLQKAGFKLLPGRGKGSHSVYKHPLLSKKTTIAGQDGKDAKKYQELEVNKIIEEVKRLEQ